MSKHQKRKFINEVKVEIVRSQKGRVTREKDKTLLTLTYGDDSEIQYVMPNEYYNTIKVELKQDERQ